MKIKNHIPNMITLANLFCGILAIKVGFSEHYYLAGFFVVVGAFFDFFDGFAARLLKVQGELGKQLDSLADMVTFGVAPGVIMYSFLKFYFAELETIGEPGGIYHDIIIHYDVYLPMIAFLIPLLSAVRLAKFNIDTNQSDKFIGLPTPANAMFFVFLPLVVAINDYGWDVVNGVISMELGYAKETANNMWSEFSSNGAVSYPKKVIIQEFKYVFVGLIIAFSLLLNAPIEMIALKFKSFGWKGNEIRFIFIGLSLVVISLSLLISSMFVSIPIIILVYIVLSVINNLFKKKLQS